MKNMVTDAVQDVQLVQLGTIRDRLARLARVAQAIPPQNSDPHPRPSL
jgi:hypothetical protein